MKSKTPTLDAIERNIQTELAIQNIILTIMKESKNKPITSEQLQEIIRMTGPSKSV